MLVDNKKNFSEYMGMAMKNEAADIILEDGDIIPLSKGQIKVIHTPGHTRGGICLMIDKFLFSGDTLFEQSIGRTDLPGGSFESIVHSIKTKLYTLADDVVVFPGHGPKTSIGIEKKINPFI
jgi:glyoxylase-like metal-dependent hydrolase (beta-lactamase superfamily II)